MSWYTKTNTEKGLNQGDIILDCPIIIPPNNPDYTSWTDIEIELFDVIILSQSCDLQHGKIKLVLVAPIFSLDNFILANPHFSDVKLQEAMRMGNLPGYHLLDFYPFETREDLKDKYLVIDFKSVSSVSFEFLNSFVLEKPEYIRVSSPYVEHLSQSYARFVMRVGLPSTIPRFKK